MIRSKKKTQEDEWMQEKWLPGNTMDRIRDLCRSRNITQVELAQAVGMDKST